MKTHRLFLNTSIVLYSLCPFNAQAAEENKVEKLINSMESSQKKTRSTEKGVYEHIFYLGEKLSSQLKNAKKDLEK